MQARVVARWPMVLLVSCIAAQGSAQGLGDAARQERERREKLKAEGKAASPVVDAAALKANKGQLANAGAPGAAEDAPASSDASAVPKASAAPGPATGDQRQEEQMWRGRMQAARAHLAAMQEQYDMLSSQHLGPQEYFIDPRTGETLIGGVSRLQRLVAEAKGLVDDAKKRIDDLEQRARREHVPPGWLR